MIDIENNDGDSESELSVMVGGGIVTNFVLINFVSSQTPPLPLNLNRVTA